jgi:hypothetical protein
LRNVVMFNGAPPHASTGFGLPDLLLVAMHKAYRIILWLDPALNRALPQSFQE